MRNDAFSLRPRNSLRVRNDATQNVLIDARLGRCTSNDAHHERAITSSYIHHLRFRDFNTRSKTQIVLRNFARANFNFHVAGRVVVLRDDVSGEWRSALDVQARCSVPGRGLAAGGAFRL
jgi:hypothetical protein